MSSPPFSSHSINCLSHKIWHTAKSQPGNRFKKISLQRFRDLNSINWTLLRATHSTVTSVSKQSSTYIGQTLPVITATFSKSFHETCPSSLPCFVPFDSAPWLSWTQPQVNEVSCNTAHSENPSKNWLNQLRSSSLRFSNMLWLLLIQMPVTSVQICRGRLCDVWYTCGSVECFKQCSPLGGVLTLRFQYLGKFSLQYICSFSPERCSLKSYFL